MPIEFCKIDNESKELSQYTEVKKHSWATFVWDTREVYFKRIRVKMPIPGKTEPREVTI